MGSAQFHDINLSEHLPLVRRLAWRVAHQAPAFIPVDDLYGEGLVGLVEARNRYDPSRGAAFTTYAWRSVRGRMLDLVGRECRHLRVLGVTGLEHTDVATPEDIAIKLSIHARLRAAVARMGARRRMVVERLLYGASLGEAADYAAIPLSRARRVRNDAYAVLRFELLGL